MTIALPPGTDPAVLRDVGRYLLARVNFLEFVTYVNPKYKAQRVHEFIAARLQEFTEAVERGESPRLMLFMPPQEGKSELASRRLTPWLLGRHPEWRVILVSYGADLAEGMSRSARRCVESDAYQKVFPNTKLDPSSTAAADWNVDKYDGGMQAIGVGGGITGKSAEVLILDDPVKGRTEVERDTYRNEQWEWWPQARDRVQEGGGIIVLCTRWHHDDLPGRLMNLASENPDTEQWEVVQLKAIAERDDPLGRLEGEHLGGRHTLKWFLNEQRLLPTPEWLSKYQQQPTAEEGAIFKADWLRFDPQPPRRAGDWVFQSMDTAYSKNRDADFTVIATWRVEKNVYRLIDLVRARMEFPDLRAATIVGAAEHQPVAILVEDIGSGKSLAQQLAAETRLPILPWKPDGDKRLRANAVTHLFAAGKVVFPREAPWLRDYVAELLQFPSGAHDDQVDATTMALAWAHQQGFAQETTTKLKSLDFTVDAETPDDTSGLYADFGFVHSRR